VWNPVTRTWCPTGTTYPAGADRGSACQAQVGPATVRSGSRAAAGGVIDDVRRARWRGGLGRLSTRTAARDLRPDDGLHRPAGGAGVGTARRRRLPVPAPWRVLRGRAGPGRGGL